MPLIDLTNVDPYGPQVEAQRRALETRNQALQFVFDQISGGIQAGRERRAALEQRNQALRDREYALINKETSALVQPQSNNKFTDVQIQQLGQQFKQEYYDAVKEWEDSDKSDEARQKFEEVKQRSLASARTVSGALDKLSAQMETFKGAVGSGGISDAVNPAVREFMADLQDSEFAMENYQIVPDEQGQLRFVGQTSGGSEVNFLLDDVANGENEFSPIPKADMPQIVNNLVQGLNAARTQVEREGGKIFEATDWGQMGSVLDQRMNELLKNENTFRAIAAGLGYGYEEFEEADKDELMDAVKEELMQQIETITPHQEKLLFDPQAQPTLVQQAQTKQAIEKQTQINDQLVTAAAKKDVEYFKNALVGRVKGIDNVTIKDNKLVLVSGFGKKATPEQVFDLNKIGDIYRLSELFGGNRDLAAMESSIINF